MRIALLVPLFAASAFAQPSAKVPLLPNPVPLPAPFATPSSTNQARVVARPDGAKLALPAGFSIDEYLSDFQVPRFMLLGPNKELLISDSAQNGNGCVWVVNTASK